MKLYEYEGVLVEAWYIEMLRKISIAYGEILSSNPSRNGRRFDRAFGKFYHDTLKENLVNNLEIMHLNNLSLGHYEEGVN
jgi:hypothetical protein